jgi:tetratricopeptide (TPR) repeat protein
MTRFFVRSMVAAVAIAALTAAAPGAAQQEFENLQVLSPDLTRPELTSIMRGFTVALGVRCSTCHVGVEGEPLNTYDMASDDKPMKRKAREMLRMVQAINGEFLASLPDRGDPALGVTCSTCHGGVSRPEPLGALLARVASGEGGDAAAARYRELRQRYFGTRAYDFGEASLQAAMEALMGAEDAASALSIGAVATEFFPESTVIAAFVGQAHEMHGDTQAAIAAYRRALELDPNNRAAQRRLEALGGGGL